MRAERWWVSVVSTPIGETIMVTDDEGCLRRVTWTDEGESWRADLARRHADIALTEARDPFGHAVALEAYMAGDVRALASIRVTFRGTPFQELVWNGLLAIPTAETRSYGELARAIGRPRAVRAVGLANGANPIAIVVPCHRVIGSDGSLTGFGGGLDRKRWLLAHEARHTRRRRAQVELPL